MDLREIISTYKKKTGASDADIAARTGVSRSTVTRWSGGTVRRISGETMRRVSEMVGFNIEPVMKGMNINVRLPVLGYVKAGYDLFAEENYLGEEEASIEDAARGDYYLKVTGDSMNGIGILDGSLVLVRQCADVDSGKIAVVTGGAQGIGACIAEMFRAEGAVVEIIDRQAAIVILQRYLDRMNTEDKK